jgi:hypothetical protein
MDRLREKDLISYGSYSMMFFFTFCLYYICPQIFILFKLILIIYFIKKIKVIKKSNMINI